MKKEISFSITALLILIITIFGFWYLINLNQNQNSNPATPNHTAEPGSEVSSSTPTGDNGNDTPAYDCNFTNAKTNTSLNMCDNRDLGALLPGLPNPFQLNGTTTVFENQFNYEVIDDLGNVIAQGMAYANSLDIGLPGPFTINDYFDSNPATSTGKVELIEYSARDGSRQVLLSVPVHFYPATEHQISVYFNNSQNDPDMLDCSNVYPVKRTVTTMSSDVGVAVHMLLNGPTDTEKDNGYFSNLPQNVQDPKVTIENDKVILDFNDDLEQGTGGSCRVTAIRSQIQETAKNADPYRRDVVISINGRTEDILQP